LGLNDSFQELTPLDKEGEERLEVCFILNSIYFLLFNSFFNFIFSFVQQLINLLIQEKLHWSD